MSIDLRKLVTTAVLRDNNYDLTAAYSDLAGRYVQMCGLLERAERLYSRAYAREKPLTEGTHDVPPNPITDDWIETGKEMENA
jgi:hypothetical protein